MSKVSIPLIVTFGDVPYPDHEVETVFESEYDSGHVIAISLKEIMADATARLLADHPDLKPAADAGGFSLAHIRKAGETSRYVVNGAYDGEGGPFGSAYEAVDAECATLQALWEMACNHFDGEDGIDLDDMVHYIGNCSVFDAEPEPVPAHVQKQLFVDLVAAMRDGGDVETALAAAEEALIKMGDLEPRAPAPKL